MEIGKDKILHFGACALIALWDTEAAVAAGVTKEWCDSRTHGNYWSWGDLLADLAGVAVGTGIRVLIAGRWNWW